MYKKLRRWLRAQPDRGLTFKVAVVSALFGVVCMAVVAVELH